MTQIGNWNNEKHVTEQTQKKMRPINSLLILIYIGSGVSVTYGAFASSRRCRRPLSLVLDTRKKKKNQHHHTATTTANTRSVSVSSVAVDNDEDDKTEIEFPAPLSKADRLKRAATFWSTALPIVASYYGKTAEIQMRERLLGSCLSDEECEVIWDEQHEKGADALSATITNLKGFYVKTAQIIASRADLFPRQYTEKLSGFTDNLDPMPVSLAKAVISQELLHKGEVFEDMFIEFDEVPLGSASIAQVHRAVLSEKYGGPKEVAVKVQRPAIEPKLLGDIANLIQLAKTFRDSLPLDYFTVFTELEKQLTDEFDFVKEAVAMDRIYTALSRTIDGSMSVEVPLVIPRPYPGLVCRRVLVMDYLHGVPLSRAREEMAKKGIDPDSPESKLFGRKLLRALTYVFGRSILETGFFHAGIKFITSMLCYGYV